MSGGSYDGFFWKCDEAAADLRAWHPDNPRVLALADIITRVGRVMHAIEWADSGDTSWEEAEKALAIFVEPARELEKAIDLADRVGIMLHASIRRAKEAQSK